MSENTEEDAITFREKHVYAAVQLQFRCTGEEARRMHAAEVARIWSTQPFI